MNKRLFKPGDIVVCIDPPDYDMYPSVGRLEYGKVYMFHAYKDKEYSSLDHNELLYLRKWNGFSGNITQNYGNCGFLQSRFKLKKDLTKKEVFKITKFKFGIKE